MEGDQTLLGTYSCLDPTTTPLLIKKPEGLTNTSHQRLSSTRVNRRPMFNALFDVLQHLAHKYFVITNVWVLIKYSRLILLIYNCKNT